MHIWSMYAHTYLSVRKDPPEIFKMKGNGSYDVCGNLRLAGFLLLFFFSNISRAHFSGGKRGEERGGVNPQYQPPPYDKVFKKTKPRSIKLKAVKEIEQTKTKQTKNNNF